MALTEACSASVADVDGDNIKELTGGLRDQGAELEARLRQSLATALATIEDLAAHEGRLLKLIQRAGPGMCVWSPAPEWAALQGELIDARFWAYLPIPPVWA